MDTFYLIIIVFIFILAIFDLMVGVSNDAVNFLNSSIGSKAAPITIIFIIASIGVFIGAGFSNGMMEIARHGIFQPQNFVFREIIFILIAAMITDIILLDLFNTLGLPTSTTVSLVFELLGATFAISILKIANDPTGLLTFGSLINTDKALSVILGIFLSVAIAFLFGLVVQFITRTIFTFNYKKNIKYFAAIFGGIAITSIIYFMLIKGIKDSSFAMGDNKLWIKENTKYILLISFVFFTILMQLLHLLKVNILKIIVLTGTFALAFAFAGNDLVNFIGLPLAGLSSFNDYMANGGGMIDTTLKMDSLLEPASTPWYFLFGAGTIMVFSLITSKKAKNVIKTELNLSRQDEGEELFNSSLLSRNLVRGTRKISSYIIELTPIKTRNWINKRFSREGITLENDASFDLVRASVNLILASLLIALGTSLKLPLSTTYVTFMVAMGTSLSDRAWGRESAVFRISGVLNVIGGWFMTAGVAFIITGIVAIIIYFGGAVAITILILITSYILIRNQLKFKNKKDKNTISPTMKELLATTDTDEALLLLRQYSKEKIDLTLSFTCQHLYPIIDAFCNEDFKQLKIENAEIILLKERINKIKKMGTIGIRRLSSNDALDKGLYFYQANDFMSEIIYSLGRINTPCQEHIDNNFNPFDETQKAEIKAITNTITKIVNKSNLIIQSNAYDNRKELYAQHKAFIDELTRMKRNQLKRIKEQTASTKVSMIYLAIIHELQNIVSYSTNLLKVSRKFQEKEV